jgi:hypothetical protein
LRTFDSSRFFRMLYNLGRREYEKTLISCTIRPYSIFYFFLEYISNGKSFENKYPIFLKKNHHQQLSVINFKKSQTQLKVLIGQSIVKEKKNHCPLIDNNGCLRILCIDASIFSRFKIVCFILPKCCRDALRNFVKKLLRM